MISISLVRAMLSMDFFRGGNMRYHYDKPTMYLSMYGRLYICDHPIYNCCTLYEIGNKGLAVIQQRFNPSDKSTWWSDIDPWLTDSIYLNAGFKEYFDQHATEAYNELFPTVTIRQIMWALKMKPIPKEHWETVFDRKDI